jgi:hypothetical protein
VSSITGSGRVHNLHRDSDFNGDGIATSQTAEASTTLPEPSVRDQLEVDIKLVRLVGASR